MSDTLAHNPRTLLHIAPYLRSRSVNPLEIFKRAGVSPSALLDANGWVPRELCFRLGNEIYNVTGERFIGADVGRAFALSDLGTWGAAVSGATTCAKPAPRRRMASLSFIKGATSDSELKAGTVF